MFCARSSSRLEVKPIFDFQAERFQYFWIHEIGITSSVAYVIQIGIITQFRDGRLVNLEVKSYFGAQR
jgi:hypothetical protein